VDATVKKHEAISADILARVCEVSEVSWLAWCDGENLRAQCSEVLFKISVCEENWANSNRG
jgi:hypothetical protein